MVLSCLLGLQRALRREMSHEMLSQEDGNPGQQKTGEDPEGLHFGGRSRAARMGDVVD